MTSSDYAVFVVDDDGSICEAVCDLLESLGIEARSFGSIAEYLAFKRPNVPACLVLDVELPTISGLEFQRQIAAADHPPIVFITGHADVPSTVLAIKGGAVDFLTKPFSDQKLLEAIRTAISLDRENRRSRAEQEVLTRRLETLTPREREVLPLVVSGLLNKQAAAELGISETTLQIHRGKIMRKMKAHSEMHLIRSSAQRETWLLNLRKSGSAAYDHGSDLVARSPGSALLTAGIIGFALGVILTKGSQTPRNSLQRYYDRYTR